MMKNKRQKSRRARVSSKIVGTTARPRLSVNRSSINIYAQVIDDDKHKTLASFSSLNLKKEEKKGKTKTDIAILVGENVAKVATKAKVKKVVFDRGSYKYHGRVKALSDAAKKGGLEF